MFASQFAVGLDVQEGDLLSLQVGPEDKGEMGVGALDGEDIGSDQLLRTPTTARTKQPKVMDNNPEPNLQSPHSVRLRPPRSEEFDHSIDPFFATQLEFEDEVEESGGEDSLLVEGGGYDTVVTQVRTQICETRIDDGHIKTYGESTASLMVSTQSVDTGMVGTPSSPRGSVERDVYTQVDESQVGESQVGESQGDSQGVESDGMADEMR